MPTWLGIDIGSTSVKVALVRSAYRKLSVARVAAADVGSTGGVSAAVREAVTMALEGEPPGLDAVATAIDGSRAAIHRLTLPATAARQLAEVLAYELESQIPFDMEGAVFDWRVLERSPAADGITVVAAVARIDEVRARITLVQEATAHEPERVGVGALVLGALTTHIPVLLEDEAVAIVDLGAKASEVLVIERGESVFARTLTMGTEGLPGTASRLAREVRVSLAAHQAQGGAAPSRVYLCGGGAFVSGAEGFLSGELETPVQLLPEPTIDTSALGDAAKELPRFAKALALALSLAGRGTGLNLRRGPLSFERGFSWVREKIPVLAGLAAVILVSFGFSAWARLYAVRQERATLESALGIVTKDVLGTEISTAQQAQDLLAKEVGLVDDDPMPHADAFDAMLRINDAVPPSMTHDIEELEVQKSHVVIRGVVGSIPDAQSIASTLGEQPCFSNVKIKSTTQAVGSDRQKYALELDLRCPEDVPHPVKKKGSEAAGAPSSGGGQ